MGRKLTEWQKLVKKVSKDMKRAGKKLDMKKVFSEASAIYRKVTGTKKTRKRTRRRKSKRRSKRRKSKRRSKRRKSKRKSKRRKSKRRSKRRKSRRRRR